MLDAKLMRVLELLTDSKEHYMSSMELAQKCDVSKRTVQTRIQELRNSLEGTGATIEAKQHIGYRLHINDNDCYKHWLEQERSDSRLALPNSEQERFATVYKGNIIKNLIMDCQSYTKYRPNETTGGIFVSWRRKEELPTGA